MLVRVEVISFRAASSRDMILKTADGVTRPANQMYDLLCYLQVCLASCGLSNSPFLVYAAYVTRAEATDNIQQLCSPLKTLQVSLKCSTC